MSGQVQTVPLFCPHIGLLQEVNKLYHGLVRSTFGCPRFGRTPLCFGFFGSACFWWCSCFLHEFEYEILAVIFSFVLLLFLLVNLIGHRLLKPSENERSKSLWGTFKEKKFKNLFLLTVWVVICCGAPVIIQVHANTISSWPLFDTTLTLAMNAIVGVIFPLVLIHLFHLIDDENQVINSIVT